MGALRPPEGFALRATKLSLVPAETIRERAPNVVAKAETLDFKTLTPEPGGLFDYKIFGPGTVIDAPPIDDGVAFKPRRTRFGRITLAEPIVHPLVLAHAPDDLADHAGWSRAELDAWAKRDDDAARAELIDALAARGSDRAFVLAELPILPPEWRPLTRLDDDRWQSSPANDHYRRLLGRNQRWARAVAANSPAQPIGPEAREVSAALRALFENEELAQPVTAANRPLSSMRTLPGSSAEFFSALAELDARDANLDGAPGRLHRAAAILFAHGLELVR